jgi:hypothetical protein
VGCSRAEDTRVRSYDETLEGCALRSCMDGAGNPCADSRIDVNVLQGTSALCRTVLVHLPMLVSICDRAVTGANSAPHGEQLTRLAGPAFGHLELLTPTPNLRSCRHACSRTSTSTSTRRTAVAPHPLRCATRQSPPRFWSRAGAPRRTRGPRTWAYEYVRWAHTDTVHTSN